MSDFDWLSLFIGIEGEVEFKYEMIHLPYCHVELATETYETFYLFLF